jgi:hypothetical protein
MTDQEIRAKALEISVLILGSCQNHLSPRSLPKLEAYLRLAREIEPRIREGL